MRHQHLWKLLTAKWFTSALGIVSCFCLFLLQKYKETIVWQTIHDLLVCPLKTTTFYWNYQLIHFKVRVCDSYWHLEVKVVIETPLHAAHAVYSNKLHVKDQSKLLDVCSCFLPFSFPNSLQLVMLLLLSTRTIHTPLPALSLHKKYDPPLRKSVPSNFLLFFCMPSMAMPPPKLGCHSGV